MFLLPILPSKIHICYIEIHKFQLDDKLKVVIAYPCIYLQIL